MRVTTKQGIVYGVPVIERGRPVMQKVKFGNREIESPVIEHVRLDANVVVDVDEKTANEWIAADLAAPYDPVLDREVELPLDDKSGKKPADPPKDAGKNEDPLG